MELPKVFAPSAGRSWLRVLSGILIFVWVLPLMALPPSTTTPPPLPALSSDCGHRFAQMAKDAQARQSLNESFVEAYGNAARSMEFLRNRGTRKVIGPDLKIGGHKAKFVAPSTDSNRGAFNHGLFFYGPDNDRRVIKLVSAVPRAQPSMPIADQQAVNRMMVGLEGAMLGETLGAPKVHGFGTAVFAGKEYYYVEMEEAFPFQNTTTWKDLTRGKNESRLNPATDVASPVMLMARQYVNALSQQVVPVDADFIIGESNEVRWVDPFAWRKRNWKDTTPGNPDRGKAGSALVHFMRNFAEHTPRAARGFFDQFLREIKTTPSMTSFEKQLLLEDLFLADHQKDPVTRQWLRDYMLAIGVSTRMGTEPYADVLRLYENIR